MKRECIHARRRLLSLALFVAASPLILNSLFLIHAAGAYYNPGTPTGFVNDFAQILSPEERQALEQKLKDFEAQTKNEIAVVTIPGLQGDTIENFAVKLFEEWTVGKKGEDNGILLLIAQDDRKMRIEVGYGLEGQLTDAQSYYIINKIMRPEFQRGAYGAGLISTVDAIIKELRAPGSVVPENSVSGESSDPVGGVFGLIFIFFFGFMWFASILARTKSWWLGGVIAGIIALGVGTAYGIMSGLVLGVFLVPIGLIFDYIVSTNYQRGKRSGKIPWWVGGSWLGGGGLSDGFGGDGFGGFGGGRSGGGGASGGW